MSIESTWKVKTKQFRKLEWQHHVNLLCHRTSSDYEVALQTVNELQEICHIEKKHTEFLNIFLTNLYQASCQQRAVSYSRGDRYYKGKQESYTTILTVIDKLRTEGFIEQYLGMHFDDAPERNTLSCSIPTNLLWRYFRLYDIEEFFAHIQYEQQEKLNLVEVVNKVKHKKDARHKRNWTERIVLKPVHYLKADRKHIKNDQKWLLNYNGIAAEQTLYSKDIQLCPFLKRVFSKKRIIYHGRYYTATLKGYQSYSEESRACFLLNGNPVIEWDYDNQHIGILYNGFLGRKTPNKFYESVPKKGSGFYERKTVKKAVLISISGHSDWGTIQSFNDDSKMFYRTSEGDHKAGDINKRCVPLFTGEGADIKGLELLDAIYKKYPDLSPFRNGNMSHELTNLDSNLAKSLMTDLLKQDIFPLVVHDSFLVEEQHGSRLYKAMIKHYVKKFKFRPKIS